MKYVQHPGVDLKISALALGTADYGAGTPSDTAYAVLDAYFESGGNFLDTAHCYAFWVEDGLGKPERLVGEYVRKIGRDRAIVATKGGHVGVPPGYPRPDSFAGAAVVRSDFEESLERLGLDSVDVYYLHRDDPRVPAAELIEIANAATGDRATYLGASNWSLERVRAANVHALARGLKPFVFWQNLWSLADPNWSNEGVGNNRFVTHAESLAVKPDELIVAPYSANANGYFASKGALGKSFDGPVARRRLAHAEELASQRAVPVSEIPLAFLRSHPYPVVPIIGTSSVDHLKAAVRAMELELSPEERQTLFS